MADLEYECPKCGATGTLAPVVVDLCAEHRRDCEECGHRMKFDLAGTRA